MQKRLISLLTVLAISLGAASAQTIGAPSPLPAGQYWGGLSTGVAPAGITFHFGLVNALGNGISLRANVATGFAGGFGLGADVLSNLPIEVRGPLAVYAGGGPYLGLGGIQDSFGLNIFAGAEYRLVELDFPAGGVFVELGPSLQVSPSFVGGFYGRGGLNIHF